MSKACLPSLSRKGLERSDIGIPVVVPVWASTASWPSNGHQQEKMLGLGAVERLKMRRDWWRDAGRLKEWTEGMEASRK